MEPVETRIISGAMYELGQTMRSDDGVAIAACNQAAQRLDEQTVQIGLLIHKNERLETAIKTTLNENLHLADGDDCTLRILKQVIKT